MRITWYKIMFRLAKQVVIIYLSSLVNAYNRTKYVSLSNHK